MADYYALEFVGGPDGTVYPPKKLDGRVIGAKERSVRSTKPAVTFNAGDRIYAGKLPAGAVMRSFSVNSDTSLGTTTLSVGTTAVPAKYVNAKTMTTTDVPTGIGPKASAIIASPNAADEDIWITLGVGGIASGVVMASFMTYTDAN